MASGQAEGHENKMCAMACCPCNLDVEKLKPLVRDPKFICTACGRVAANKENLCEPEAL